MRLESIIAYTLSLLGILIALIIPVPLAEEYRLFIISIIIFIFIIIILANFNRRLGERENKIETLDKKFKTIESLNDIRLDIRELKRKVFK